MLRENILSSVSFKRNECVEFSIALKVIGEKEKLLKIANEMGFSVRKEDEALIEQLDGSVSQFLRQELEYFFSICDIGVLGTAFALDYDQSDDVKALLSLISSAEEAEICHYLGSIFISNLIPATEDMWEEMNRNVSGMIQFIEESDVEDELAKQRVLECLRNPEETKQRIAFLYRQFYEKAYKNIEGQVFEEIEHELNLYQQQFEEHPVQFLNQYFYQLFQPEENQWPYKIHIHLSFFQQVGFWSMSIHDYREKAGWVALGIRSKEHHAQRELRDLVDDFLKAISDKKRINIIKMLAQKPHYGYEIASLLKLTPATVSYHMNLMFETGIVILERQDNKVYYLLDKQRFKDMMDASGKVLLNEI
ncbi:helix-turn-helix transcriptional regulator [Jeotgalibacillus sp. R-1-5s-1]|uniref:ArsR/SmtB family transcription factor n=1 Tax=Jeotgalibacillus sp. R-1-5s-1 TaxID=2555897 RepID=UPI00141B6A5B|nr:metalloregulator ArsR/SmtB family transcription factor [Jeotgalibacillus sp. R-1-5s-1]